VIESVVTIDETEDFYIGGELRSAISIMPYDSYVLRYNVIPLQIGRLPLPKLSITDREKNTTLIQSFTRKCLIVK
jgi:hypothetical protein